MKNLIFTNKKKGICMYCRKNKLSKFLRINKKPDMFLCKKCTIRFLIGLVLGIIAMTIYTETPNTIRLLIEQYLLYGK